MATRSWPLRKRSLRFLRFSFDVLEHLAVLRLEDVEGHYLVRQQYDRQREERQRIYS